MRLRVHCEDWVLGDRGYGVAIGDAFSEVLVLHGVEGSWPLELVTTHAVGVTPLPRWEGLSLGHDAYRLEIGPVTAYCESPLTMTAGPGEMTGVLSVDTHLAPVDWPVTPGVVVRMWTEHRWYVQDPAQGGTWVFESPHARYEGVTRVGLNRDEWPVPGETRREARTGVLLEVDVEPAG